MDKERKTIPVVPRKPAAYRYDEQLPAESALLEELLKTADLQQLFESFYQLVNIPVAVIDLHANVLVSSRWQRICMLFHRVHPLACSRCIESDTYLATQLQEGKEYAIYECRNGLTDCASPIFIDGKHVANLFIGQFLTRAPDEEWFRRQGREFGFDETDYLAALHEVPVVEPEKIPVILNLLVRMTGLITTMAISRKQALEAQARQSIILNTIPQSVFWKDINGRYLGCNAAFAKATGLDSPEDIIGKTDFDLPWPHEEAEAYRADDRAVISANQPRLHIIEPVQRADGQRIVVDTSKVPLMDTAGSAPTGVVGIYEDITVQTRAAEALRESEARFRTLSENSLAGIYIVQEGRLTYVNPALAQIFGYQVSELIDADPLLVIHPDDRALVSENMRRRLSGEMIAMHYEFRGLRKDGSTNYIEVLGTRMETEGHPAIIGNIIEITERKLAEDELRKSEVYRRAIFDSARDAIIVMRNELFIDCNAVALTLYGTDRESFIGHTPYEFSPPTQPDGKPSKDSALEKIGAALNGAPQFFEWKHKKLNGVAFDAEVSLGRVEVGKEVFIQAIVRDVTERKHAEVVLRQLNRQLRAISACNEFLVRAEEEKALLEGICTIVCAQGGYRMAWVGYAERDEGKTVRPVAWAGAEVGYVTSANITWADTERGRGPTGACIRSAEAIYIQDFATDPRVAPWRDSALRHGFRSSIALPLKESDGTPFGALMVYSADANAFTPDEIQLLDQLANDLAFGITALRTRTERIKAEESLRKSEERFQLSMEATSDGLWDWNAETNEVYYSPACYHMLGYEVGDFPGTLKGWQDLLHPDDVEHTMKINMDCVEGRRETFAVEYRLRAKNGEWRWILGRGKSIVRDAQGRSLRLVGTNTDITERRRTEEQIKSAYARATKTLDDTIVTMAKIVEMRDPYTAGHQERVTSLAVAIAREMNLDPERIEHLKMAAIIHDIGKINIAADILSKPGRLNKLELQMIMTHAQSGYEIVSNMNFLPDVAETILQHHERLDGSGYPGGLKGEDIRLEARILSVADVVEAMASHRPYRPARGIDAALAEIAQNSGKFYDAEVCGACLKLFAEKRFQFHTDDSMMGVSREVDLKPPVNIREAANTDRKPAL